MSRHLGSAYFDLAAAVEESAAEKQVPTGKEVIHSLHLSFFLPDCFDVSLLPPLPAESPGGLPTQGQRRLGRRDAAEEERIRPGGDAPRHDELRSLEGRHEVRGYMRCHDRNPSSITSKYFSIEGWHLHRQKLISRARAQRQ